MQSESEVLSELNRHETALLLLTDEETEIHSFLSIPAFSGSVRGRQVLQEVRTKKLEVSDKVERLQRELDEIRKKKQEQEAKKKPEEKKAAPKKKEKAPKPAPRKNKPATGAPAPRRQSAKPQTAQAVMPVTLPHRPSVTASRSFSRTAPSGPAGGPR